MAWRLLGSNNGGSSWTTLDIRTNQTFTASQQTLSWSVAAPEAYNVYRLLIDCVSNAAANSMQLDEIQLLSQQPPTYSYFWQFGDGTTSNAQNPQHTYTNNGTYGVTLQVSTCFYTATKTQLISVGTAPGPLLGVSVGGNSLAISWPGWASGWALYATTNLTPPAVWSPVTNMIVSNGQFNVTVPIGSGAQFFRLSSPE